jgi:flagellar hook assembly protein FlgD
MQGELVRTLVNNADYTTGSTGAVTWDGRNQEGQIVASGIYLTHIRGPQFTAVYKIAVVH